LPARVLSKGLFSSCDEDTDKEKKEEKTTDEKFIKMFVGIRAEKWSSFIDRAFPKALCREKKYNQ